MGIMDQFKEHMVKPSSLNKPNFIALYGNPGSGKTWLAASISDVPSIKKTLIIDSENSTQGSVAGFDDDRVDIVPVSTHAGFEAVWDAVVEADAAGELEYDAVIIDTLDVAQDRALEYFDAVQQAKPKPDGFAKWGDVKKWTEGIGRQAQEMNALVIVVTHSKREKEESGAFSDLFSLAGSAKDSFPGIPDIVGFTEREGDTTTVHVGSSKKRSTKNRFGLEDTLENPTMTTILEAISGNGKKSKTTNKKEDK